VIRSFTKKTPHGPPAARAKAATLADIARIAGVVPMTASRAINNSGYVGKEVREKVLAAARQLNYRPNILARTLRGQVLHAVGIMLPDISNPFSAELVEGMKSVLVPAGYAVFLATANRSVEQEKASLLAFADHRIDGILVATRGTHIGNRTIAEIARRGVPMVTVGRPIERSKVDCVTANHRRGAFEAVNHLIELGHRRIAFLGIAPEDCSRLRRFQGYAEALAAAGIPLGPEYIVGPVSGPDYATQEDGCAGMKVLAALRRPPTAVFARNDYTAIGALRAAYELGLSVPGDLALAGFDNIPLSAYTNPPLTTVEQPIAEQGRYAAQFLLDRIEGGTGKRREVCLECRLIVRGSTDAGAAGTGTGRSGANA
jgi:DNA-binding LacI/PurR family transcriptional regulator